MQLNTMQEKNQRNIVNHRVLALIKVQRFLKRILNYLFCFQLNQPSVIVVKNQTNSL